MTPLALAAEAIDAFISHRNGMGEPLSDQDARQAALDELAEGLAGVQLVMPPMCCLPEPHIQYRHEQGCPTVARPEEVGTVRS